jgi:predicted HicB family RNase H-like nuclease
MISKGVFGVECLDNRVREKKSRQFAVQLDGKLAEAVKALAGQLKMSMGDMVRRCVAEQLNETATLRELSRKRRTLQLSVRFEDSLMKNMDDLARRTDKSLGEIVRLCLTRQLAKIQHTGGIKIKLPAGGK